MKLIRLLPRKLDSLHQQIIKAENLLNAWNNSIFMLNQQTTQKDNILFLHTVFSNELLNTKLARFLSWSDNVVSLLQLILHNNKHPNVEVMIFRDFTDSICNKLICSKTWKTFQYLTIKLSYVSMEEALTIVIMSVFKKRLSIFRHFLVKKQTQFTFRLFQSQSPRLSNHMYYFRYGSLFCKYISWIDYVQINEPRYSGYDPGWLFH